MTDPGARGFITVEFRARLDDETKQYVARCDDLGVSTAGDTLDEAYDNLLDAVVLYLNTLEEVGDRDRVLRESRIEVRDVEDDTLPRTMSVLPHEHVSVQHVPVAAMA